MLAGPSLAGARMGTPPPVGDRVLPSSFAEIQADPGGGTVWRGVIQNPLDRHERPSAIYLPPGFSTGRAYPVVYLLHGMPGTAESIYGSLHLAQLLDGAIATGRIVPFVVVMPAAADSATSEWAGMWERYVVGDVVPWVDAHLPTIRAASGRAIAGICAGGFGAMDIGLRHPSLFGVLESWEGYFAPVFRDGPFAQATPAVLRANDPSLLVRSDASMLRHAEVRFYVSVGGNHGDVLRIWSIRFAQLLDRLHLRHALWQLPAAERGHFWRATVPSALQFASAGFAADAVDVSTARAREHPSGTRPA